jgi:intermediate peptidase
MKETGLNTRYQLQARFSNRNLQVYPGSLQAQMIMRSAPLEEPRRKVYLAANGSSPERIELLEAMLRARAYLAQVLGHDSFSRLTLSDKMAKSPGSSYFHLAQHIIDACVLLENVMSFLDALMDHTRPFARSALKTLSTRKQAHLNTASLPVVQAWDRDYYCPPEAPAPPIPLPPLTLGTVFMGLSRLFKNIYGVTLRPADVAPGEVWHHDVRKLEVVDEDAGVIGWVYADLFARRGKASGAAHYTVRCSRRVDDDDVAGDAVHGGLPPDHVSSNFGNASRRRVRGQDGEFQLPIVVVLCEFAPPSLIKGGTILEWHDVTTLFHEMGHVMHCICSNYLHSRHADHLFSNDRTHGVPERVRNPLCDRRRRAAFDPHGALPPVAAGLIPLLNPRHNRTSCRQPPRRPVPVHRHTLANPPRDARPGLPLALRPGR